MKRGDLLSHLIDGSIKPDYAWKYLKELPFDSQPLVILRVSHISSILKRFIDNDISNEEIEDWANVIEVRDDIEFDQNDFNVIKESILELANPVLFGSLDFDKAKLILERIGSRAH